jgi:hypothetical protein
MKKFFYIAAFVLSTGVITSCTKEKDVTPTVTKISSDSEDNLGIVDPTPADGGVDRPKKGH